MDQLALKWILKAEGGYVNHPQDPGGETNKGITVGTLSRARKDGLTKTQSVKDLTNEDVNIIYSKYYWEPCKADKIIAPVNLVHFDCTINCGVGGSAKQIQRAYNSFGGRQVKIQGKIANELVELINKVESIDMVKAYFDERLRFYKSLKTFATFGKGWTNRLKNLAKHIGSDWNPK